LDVIIIGAIAFLVAFTLLSIFMIIRNIRLFFFITLGFTLIFLGLFTWIFLDVIDMQKYFQNSTSVVFLEDNNVLLTGLVLRENPIIMNKTSLDFYSELYKDKEYDIIKGQHYKLMVYSIQTVKDLPEIDFALGEFILSKEDAIKALLSDDPGSYLTDGGLYIDEDPYWIKAYIFGTILTQGIMDINDPLYFFVQYKKGNIFIYPKTAIFKVIKFVPLELIKSALKRTVKRIKVEEP